MKLFISFVAFLTGIVNAAAMTLAITSFAPPPAAQLFTYASANSCTLSLSDKSLVSTLDLYLLRDGILPLLDIAAAPGIMPGATGADTCAYINLASPGYASSVMEYGDITFQAYSGLTGDSSVDSYSLFGVSPSAMSNCLLNSCHISIWPLTITAAEANPDFSVAGTNTFELGFGSTAISLSRVNVATNLNGGAYSENSVLMNAADRTSSSVVNIYQNGQLTCSACASESTSKTTANLSLFRANATYGDATLAWYAAGAALSGTQELSLSRDVNLALQYSGAVPGNPNSDACNGVGSNPCLPAYFQPTMIISPTGLQIIQNGNPPASNSITGSTYVQFPLTVAKTQDMQGSESTTWTGGSVSHFIWASNYNRPNPIYPTVVNSSGLQCRAVYSTLALADAAWQANVSWTMGNPAHIASGPLTGDGWLDLWESGGGTSGTWLYHDSGQGTPDLVDGANSLCAGSSGSYVTISNYLVLTQATLLPQTNPGGTALPGVGGIPQGVTLDWEVHDNHTCAQTAADMALFSALVHGSGEYKAVLYTNPLDGPNFTTNGFCAYGSAGANTDTILGYVDYWTLLSYDGNASGDIILSLKNQIGTFEAPIYSKFLDTIELGNTTTTDAYRIVAYTNPLGFAGYGMFPAGSTLGGQCSRPTNEKIGIYSGIVTC